MPSNKIGRNDPCPCGSGLKYKKCCLNRTASGFRTQEQSQPEIISPTEPHLQILSSIVHNGYRFRIVFNRVYQRPLSETFHEFLVEIIKWTFGEVWWRKQKGMSRERRHNVLNWCEDFFEFKKNNITDDNKLDTLKVYEADASGPVWALMTLGYDLFCLQTENKLPDRMIERLRKNISFQSVRYEILTAAFMLRFGFDIRFLDEDELNAKHCEFIAKDIKSGLEIGVEAKSRKRDISDEKYNSDRDSRALYRLINTAVKQKPDDIPYIIFIDVNTVLTPGTPLTSKPWFIDIDRAIGKMDIPTAEKPDIYTAIVVTNFAFSLEDPNLTTSLPEHGIIAPLYCIDPIPDIKWLDDLNANLKRYAAVPSEV